jgi:hypothetical protein
VCVFGLYAFDLFFHHVWIELRCVFHVSVGMTFPYKVYATATLNAYSLHLHIDAHAKALRDQCKPDSSFPPPPHRKLWLDGNQLVCAPLTAQARAALTIYYGPSTLCALRTCEAGKFSTICIPHCFTVDHQHRPVQCVHVFLAKYEHGMCQRMQAQVN